MQVKKDIYKALGWTVVLTMSYYFTYAFVELKISDWCKNNICFEFPPYADILSIWVAIIGLYFVVTSLDAWKHQDQYQTAKANIKLLHKLADDLEKYDVQLSRLEDNKQVYFYPEHILNNNVTKAELFLKYEYWLDKKGILNFIKDTDYKITQQEMNLLQKEFNSIINLAHKYVIDIDENLKKRNDKIMGKYQNKIVQKELDKNGSQQVVALVTLIAALNKITRPNLTQEDIDLIMTKEMNTHEKFKNELRQLQKNLNKYIE